MSSSPERPAAAINRVNEVLQRMQDNISNVDALKTCCGILAILSRDESNKLQIARDGIRLIVAIMEMHIGRPDLLEAACDLLWSLAFNNALVKDVVGRHGAIPVILRGMKVHVSVPDFLKSACGAVSNLCQVGPNQALIASKGGTRCLLEALRCHLDKALLLPFILDALASLIVGNDAVAQEVSGAGVIGTILGVMTEHASRGDLVKSACHTLAILSDTKGQGCCIASAGGVKSLLPTLCLHPCNVELHRVAAVVLLRMLQEAPVAREIAKAGGIPLMLAILLDQLNDAETVAAVSYILYAITHPDVLSPPSPPDPPSPPLPVTIDRSHIRSLLAVLRKYPSRKDIVRACMRCLVNLATRSVVVVECLVSECPPPVDALLGCVLANPQAKDVATCTVVLLRHMATHRANATTHRPTQAQEPLLPLLRGGAVSGLVLCLRAKPLDCLIAILTFNTAHRALLKEFGGCEGVGGDGEGAPEWEEGMYNEALVWAKNMPNRIQYLSSKTQQKKADGGELDCALRAVVRCLRMLLLRRQRCTPTQDARHVEVMVAFKPLYDQLSHGPFLGSGDHYSPARADLAGLLEAVGARNILPRGDLMSRTRSDGEDYRDGEGKGEATDRGDSKGDKDEERDEDGAGRWRGGEWRADGKNGEEEEDDDEDEEGMGPGRAGCKDEDGPTRGRGHRRDGRRESSMETECSSPSHGALGTPPTGRSGSGGSHGPTNGPGNGPQAGNGRGGNDPPEPRRNVQWWARNKTLPPGAALVHPHLHQLAPLLSTPPPFLEPVGRPRDALSPFASALLSSPPATSGGGLTMTPLLRGPSPPGSALDASSSSSSSRATSSQSSAAASSRMQVVYEAGSAAGLGVESRLPTPVPYTVPPPSSDAGGPRSRPFAHSLRFDSAFESGNLLRAVQRGEWEYDLFLRADLHTSGYTQWFYFAFTDTHTPEQVALYQQQQGRKNGDKRVSTPTTTSPRLVNRVTFNIVNLTKPDSLFNMGMRPVLYSYHDAKAHGLGWCRTASDIQYRANCYTRMPTPQGQQGGGGSGSGFIGAELGGGTQSPTAVAYYTLSFSLDLCNPGDVYLIAHSYPYTYSDHKAHLRALLAMGSPSRRHLRHSLLCTTLGGHDCDLLTITDFSDGDEDDLRQRRKKRIVLTGRVHPGETPASWMMKGILDFLTSDGREAAFLRSMFVFKIVPMLNPDGVIYGNNRCSLAGLDLNRQWKRPAKAVHPTVFAIKTLLRSERMAQRDVFMYVDLHGHSRKQNVFMYGCDADKRKPRPAVRVFPKLLSWNRLGQKYVSFKDCSFHVKKNRETTARVVVCRELSIRNSYTLEATFCGADFGPLKNYHFNTLHFQEAGAALCDGLIDYLFPNAAHREAMLAHPCPMPTNTHSSSGGAGLSQEEEEATVKAAASDPMEGEGDDLSSESEDENEQRRPNSNPNGGRSTGGSGGSGGSNAGTPTADAMHMGDDDGEGAEPSQRRLGARGSFGSSTLPRRSNSGGSTGNIGASSVAGALRGSLRRGKGFSLGTGLMVGQTGMETTTLPIRPAYLQQFIKTEGQPTANRAGTQGVVTVAKPRGRSQSYRAPKRSDEGGVSSELKAMSTTSAMAKLSISGTGGSPPHHTSAMIRTVEQAAQQSSQSGMLMVMGSGTADEAGSYRQSLDVITSAFQQQQRQQQQHAPRNGGLSTKNLADTDAAKTSGALSRDPLRYHPLLKLAGGNDSPTTDPEDDARPPQQPTGLSGLGEGGPSSPNRTLLAKLSTGVHGTRLAPTHGAGSTADYLLPLGGARSPPLTNHQDDDGRFLPHQPQHQTSPTRPFLGTRASGIASGEETAIVPSPQQGSTKRGSKAQLGKTNLGDSTGPFGASLLNGKRRHARLLVGVADGDKVEGAKGTNVRRKGGRSLMATTKLSSSFKGIE